MRSRVIFPWLAGAVLALTGGWWWHESAAREALEARADALAREEERLVRLHAERDRLREELLATAASAAAVLPAPTVRPPDAPVAAPVWQTGEWTPTAAWSNEGRATPQAAMATLLWSAANGDVAVLRGLLSFDEVTLAKARAWFESLPPASRAQYRTPEDLVVGVTLGNIPQTRAQLSWSHQVDADHAIIGMLVAEPAAPSSPAATLAYQPAVENLPPSLRQDRSPYRVVVLNVIRAPDGWRVSVPATAIDGMARWLRRPGGE